MTIQSYFRMPIEDRVGFTDDGWCRTGDIGYLTEAGGLFIKGRKKHIIRVGSYTVLPNEVEEVVIRYPGVALATVVGIPDKIYGEVVWLIVVPEAGKTLSESDIIAYCQDQLADFKVPKKVFIRDHLPTTHIGKVDRVTLAKELLASQE